MASRQIYQFYAELEDFEPKIWRRFQVQSDITVARFAYIVMIMYEMKASHLFRMEVQKGKALMKELKEFYSASDYQKIKKLAPLIENYTVVYEMLDFIEEMGGAFDDNIKSEDVFQAKLKHAVNKFDELIELYYDFGDNWCVNLTLEKIIEDQNIPSGVLPRILEGEGYGIIEDVGGTRGLSDLAMAFFEQKGEAYEEYSRWLGVDTFDISHFDLDDLNFRIKKIPIIYQHIYQDEKELTPREIALLEREYLTDGDD
jgi:hypothetical protein